MIAILGAGAIGGYLGGRLAASGAAVTLIGRARTMAALGDGLTVVPLGGEARRVAPEAYRLAEAPAGLAAASTILVCVKSRDTAEAGRLIADHAPPGAVTVSLQNGLGNVEVLEDGAGGRAVVPGIVGFNVVRPDPATFRQTTGGEVIVGPRASALAAALSRAGLIARTHPNMAGVQWGKLLLNLNNPLNALSGRPLVEELADRSWRLVLAACMAEAIAVARAKGVRMERVGRLPPALIPTVLRLPTPLFRAAAATMLRADPEARSSMADDLAAGRPSELPWLNGRVADEGRATGVPTPANDAVIALTEAAFREGASPRLDGRAALERVRSGRPEE